MPPIHRIIVCHSCRNGGGPPAPLAAMLCGLRRAFGDDGPDRRPRGSFRISTVSCMAGCDRPRTVAFQAAGKAAYLFGDIDLDRDLEALVDFAGLYADRADGWSRAAERPATLATKTLARIPGAGQP